MVVRDCFGMFCNKGPPCDSPEYSMRQTHHVAILDFFSENVLVVQILPHGGPPCGCPGLVYNTSKHPVLNLIFCGCGAFEMCKISPDRRTLSIKAARLLQNI